MSSTKAKTIAELKAEFGDKFRVFQGPLWKQEEVLEGEPVINKDQLTTQIMQGRPVTFLEGHSDDCPRIYVRGQMPDDAKSFRIHACSATRDTPREFGGYNKGDMSVGLYAS